MKKLFIFLLALLPMTLMAQDNPVVKSLFEEPETRYLKMKQKEHLKALDNKFKKAAIVDLKLWSIIHKETR